MGTDKGPGHIGVRCWLLGLLLMVAAMQLTIGCSQVTVTPITKANRRTQGGFRYYLARPFVAVKQPFAIAGRDYYVKGTLKVTDGQMLVTNISFPSGLREFFPGGTVPGNIIQDVRGATAEAGHGGGGQGGGNQSGTPAASQPANTQAASQPSTGGAGGGNANQGNNMTASSGTGSNPVLALNDLYDVVMLPDFDEQYAIELQPGIGTSQVSLAFKDGWMLESVGVQTDNSQITTGVFATIGKLIDLKGTLATAAASVATPTTGPTKQAGNEGQQVYLKIRAYKEVEPGLYPLLKPNKRHRLEQAAAKAAVAENVRNDKVKAAATRKDEVAEEEAYGSPFQEEVALPDYPYTLVPFNVMRRVTVELLSLGPVATAPAATLPSTSTDETKAVEGWLDQLDVQAGSQTVKASQLIGGSNKILSASLQHGDMAVIVAKDVTQAQVDALVAQVKSHLNDLTKQVGTVVNNFSIIISQQ